MSSFHRLRAFALLEREGEREGREREREREREMLLLNDFRGCKPRSKTR